MKCEKVKEIILDDYLNAEISDKQKKALEDHVGQCPACNGLYNEAKGILAEMVSDVPPHAMPEQVWENVKSTIQAETKEKTSLSTQGRTIREKIRSIINIPRPAFAITGVAFVLIISLIAGAYYRKERLRSYAVMQNETVEFLVNEYIEFTSLEDEGNGFFIDEYFL